MGNRVSLNLTTESLPGQMAAVGRAPAESTWFVGESWVVDSAPPSRIDGASAELVRSHDPNNTAITRTRSRSEHPITISSNVPPTPSDEITIQWPNHDLVGGGADMSPVPGRRRVSAAAIACPIDRGSPAETPKSRGGDPMGITAAAHAAGTVGTAGSEARSTAVAGGAKPTGAGGTKPTGAGGAMPARAGLLLRRTATSPARRKALRRPGAHPDSG